eukprot:6212075-Pleurochrysis_carterae.AAC.2
MCSPEPRARTRTPHLHAIVATTRNGILEPAEGVLCRSKHQDHHASSEELRGVKRSVEARTCMRLIQARLPVTLMPLRAVVCGVAEPHVSMARAAAVTRLMEKTV